jgi:cation diffusion facilitator family transporter
MFMIIETIGGIYTDATAILADAAHMFSDVAGFMISFVSIYISKRPTNFNNSYGYHRVEVLGAICSVFFIWFLLVGINGLAAYKIYLGNTEEGYFLTQRKAYFFLGTACFGLSCNLLNLLALNCFCNGEDDDEEDDDHNSVVSDIKYSTNQTVDASREELAKNSV